MFKKLFSLRLENQMKATLTSLLSVFLFGCITPNLTPPSCQLVVNDIQRLGTGGTVIISQQIRDITMLGIVTKDEKNLLLFCESKKPNQRCNNTELLNTCIMPGTNELIYYNLDLIPIEDRP